MAQFILQNQDEDKISIHTSTKKFDMRLSKEDEIMQLYISDYVSLPDYIEKMKKIDILGVDRLLSNFLLWNSEKQMVNPGTYYIIEKDNIVYNVLIGLNDIMLDECYQNESGKKEKVIKVEIATGEFTYSVLRHDNIGSTFLESCYSSVDDDFYSVEEECSEAIKKIVSHVESIKMLDLSFFRKTSSNHKTKVKKM